MVTLVNRAKVSTATTGTGTITLGTAESGYQTFAAAGVVNSDVVRYVIEDGTDWEIGTGTYSAGTLTRTVLESSNADAALNLTGSAVVYVSATAEDIPPALELYAENPSSPTAPSATGTNAVAIGGSTVSSALHSVSLGRACASGADSFAAAIANNTSSYGATGANSVAIGYFTKATGVRSVALGYQSTASADYAVALGRSLASGGDSFSAAIGSTSASYGASNNNSVALGANAKASGLQSFAAGGFDAQATGTRSVAIGGFSPRASGAYTIALGWASVPQDRKMGYSQLRFAASGDAQLGTVVLATATTDATPTILSFDNFTPSNIIILPNNSAYAFSGTIVARQQASAGSEYASWEIKGALLRDGTAASTVLGNGIKNKLYASAGASAWDIALTADTTNGGLAITVTGAAATNIRWVATVNTSEVTY